MKLSTNHAHEKTAWLEALQMPGQSPKLRKHSEKTTVTSPSPWVERLPGSISERTYSVSKSSPPRSDSFGSPPNSATPKNSLSTSGIHSQVFEVLLKVMSSGQKVQGLNFNNYYYKLIIIIVVVIILCISRPSMDQNFVLDQHHILLPLI